MYKRQVQDDGDAHIGGLPRGFAACEAGADDVDGGAVLCVIFHQGRYREFQGRTQVFVCLGLCYSCLVFRLIEV